MRPGRQFDTPSAGLIRKKHEGPQADREIESVEKRHSSPVRALYSDFLSASALTIFPGFSLVKTRVISPGQEKPRGLAFAERRSSRCLWRPTEWRPEWRR